MTTVNIIIPARFHSTRLPGKPLLDIAGKPMIQRVYEQACKAQINADSVKVMVATDSMKIADVVTGFGGKAIMTSENHLSGTDRLAEVVDLLAFDKDDIVINVQGDEPLIPPEVISQVAQNILQNPQFDMATLATKIDSESEFQDPSVVKVVTDCTNRALYFSRSPIPFTRDQDADSNATTLNLAMRHIGLYAYRASLLVEFKNWQPAAIEQAECLEQLRI